MKYTVYYVQRDKKTAIKADLFAEEGEGRTKMEFEASDDIEARNHIAKTIAPDDPRGLKNVSVLGKCRGVKPRDTKPMLMNLNDIGPNLRTKIETALSPLVTSGDLTIEEGRVRPKSRNQLTEKEPKNVKAKDYITNLDLVPGNPTAPPPVHQAEPKTYANSPVQGGEGSLGVGVPPGVLGMNIPANPIPVNPPQGGETPTTAVG